MSSVSPARAPIPAARPPAHAAPSASAGPSIDPVKLFKKYMWVLAAAGVVGGGLGVVANLILGETVPRYVSSTIYKVRPANLTLDNLNITNPGNSEELQRYMQTEAATMRSDRILTATIENPSLQGQLPDYYSQFLDGQAFDKAEALKDLEKRVSAAADSETLYIRVRVTAPDAATAQTLGDFLRRAYQEDLRRKSNADLDQRRKDLSDAVAELQDEIEREQRRRDRLISENQTLDTLEARSSRAAQTTETLVRDLAEIRESITITQVRLDEYRAVLDNPSGINYPEEIRTQIENQIAVQQVMQQLRNAELLDRQLELEGLGARHPDRIRSRAGIDAANQTLAIVREREMRRLFDEQIETLRLSIRQFTTRETEILEELDELRAELNELTRTIAEVEDIDERLLNLQTRLAQRETGLEDIQYAAQGGGAQRIELEQSPSRPDERSFPQLIQMVPAGFLLIVGLTGGVIVLIELMDQRIKGPADIAMIPRTRVLGILPMTSDDPSRPEQAETAYRDHPRGVFAEAVRQIRGPLLKRIHQEGHRSLLVVPATPKSGATSVAVNLAEACSRSDMRVLLIDANTRRPAVHSVLGLEPGPGLVDVLGGGSPAGEVIQRTDNASLDVMCVGSAEHRMYEGIASRAMGELLTQMGEQYDLVIVDVAPAMVSGDATGLASRVDSSLLVARAMSEKRGLIARLKNELAETRAEFLGVILNAVRPSAGGYFKTNIRATHAYQNSGKSSSSDAS